MKPSTPTGQTSTASTTSKANTKQVGGNHYRNTTGVCPHCKGEIQHWDLFARMPYLEGYATKELLRHTEKNGKQDLEKAIHIIQKMIEVHYPDTPVQVEGALAMEEDLDALAKAAKERADAYAVRRQDDDVPAGWVLEQRMDGTRWHFRQGEGGLWGDVFPTREAALKELLLRAQ